MCKDVVETGHYHFEHRKKVLALFEEIELVIKTANIEKELEKAQQLLEADYFRDQSLPPLGHRCDQHVPVIVVHSRRS